MKEKPLRIIIYTIGFICLVAFLSIRIFPLMNALLSDKMDRETRDFNTYGDLFYSNCINHFKIEFPKPVRKYRLSDKNPAVTDADILTFGDSFFDFSFHTTFPERLSDTLNKKVYSYITQDPALSNPFCILNQNEYGKAASSKYVIFETIERNIPVKFNEPYDPSCISNKQRKKAYDEVRNFIFNKKSEQLYALLLKRGHVVNRIYSHIVTIRFDLFGYISPLTGKYRLQEDPWLFYEKEFGNEAGGFYYRYTSEEISTYAENIRKLGKTLKDNYNLDLIFMAVPNKYSIYHTMINNDQYNNFLPRLYSELDKLNVRYINLYHEFTNTDDTLYFGTDTHWNKKGLDRALNLMLEEMNPDSSLALISQQENGTEKDNPNKN